MSPVDAISATLRLNSLGLIDVFEFAHFEPGTNLLVIIDQFEELFRYRSAGTNNPNSYDVSEEATAFVRLLLEAHANPTYPIYIAITMRSDFLGECSLFEGLPEAINEGQYLVPRMTRDERREAIAGPINVSGGELSPVLLTRLVNDVGDNPDQLSILQHAINRTWEHWRRVTGGHGPLSLEHYEAVGTMARALDLHAEEAYGELATDQSRRICERIFKALTDRGTDARGIRRPMPLKSLCDVTGFDRDSIVEVINFLRMPSRSFLLPPYPEELDAGTVIDISHEILMRVWNRLRLWSEEEAQSANTYRRLVETAELHSRGRAALYRDPDLQMALDWQATEFPNPAWAGLYSGGYDNAMQFLAASSEARSLEKSNDEFKRRWDRIQVYLAVLFALAFLPAGINSGEWMSPAIRSYVEHILINRAVKTGVTYTGTSKFYEQVISGSPWALTALLCLLAYAAVAYFGHRAFRRIAYPAIARAVRAASVGRAQPRQQVAETSSFAYPESFVAGHAPEYASFWRRFVSCSINLFVLFALWGLALLCTAGPSSWLKLKDSDPLDKFLMWMCVVSIMAVPPLYYWFTRRSRMKGTVGEFTSGITLARTNGKPPGYWLLLWRAIAFYVDWTFLCYGFVCVVSVFTKGVGYVFKELWWTIPLGILGAAGIGMQFFSCRRQTFHDLVSRVVVVRRTPTFVRVPPPPPPPPPPLPNQQAWVQPASNF